MSDDMRDSFRETGEIMNELVVRAKETMKAGGSRRDFFFKTAKLAGATALGAAGAGLLQPIAAKAATATVTDTTLNILNIAATAEALATTLYYNALTSDGLPDVNDMANRNYFQAAVVQEYTHLEILRSLGGNTLTLRFYVPDGFLHNEKVFFQTMELLETYFISAYTAAAIEFAGTVSSGITSANTTALGLCVQILGVECEHRALLRVAGGMNPANNVLIESALVPSVGAAVTPLMPFISAGTSGYVGPLVLPSKNLVNNLAEPYGFSSFPSYTIV